MTRLYCTIADRAGAEPAINLHDNGQIGAIFGAIFGGNNSQQRRTARHGAQPAGRGPRAVARLLVYVLWGCNVQSGRHSFALT